MTSINYQHKDYNTIFKSYLHLAANYGLINGDEEYIKDILTGNNGLENLVVMELAIHSQIISETYQKLTRIHNSYDLDRATGEELDQLLEPFITRHPHVYATTQICFEKNPQYNSTIKIPFHTQITSQKYPDITFETVQEAVIKPTTKEVCVEARCTFPGRMGNIPASDFNQNQPSIKGIKRIYSFQAATGGRNQEDDTNYRQRGYNWSNINTHGTYHAIRNTLDSIETVENYIIQPLWNGPGTTRILIDPPTKKVLETVESYLESIKAVNEKYTIKGIKQKKINIDITLKLELEPLEILNKQDKGEIVENIKTVVKTYIEGGINRKGESIKGLGLGKPFSPSHTAAYILNQIPLIQDIHILKPAGIIDIRPDQRAQMGEIHATLI